MAKSSFRLNKQQQEVVDHKSGPLLVVAGAGTGKTRVIVEKINKLLDSGVNPAAILAVTFTEKAAAEMLDRLLSIREGFLPDIQITTFNGFGESLLREFGSHIGLVRNFKLLGEQAQIVFTRERIDEFELDYFLPLSNLPDAVLDDILDLFSQLKQHIITPEIYIRFAKDLPANNEAEVLQKSQHQELARAYEKYINLCRQENVIDYDDQIYLLLELLEKRPNIRSILQQRFHTLFVDEFQDTNPMQSRLIDLLVNKQQNLIVVGDDDQSIYGFRGASLANILNFKKRYPKANQIALTENYRSSQAILDAAYKLIVNNNPNRLEHTLKINKRLTSKQPGNAPVIKRFETLNDELGWIAEDIATRIKTGVEPGDIAVLARRRQTATIVHEALDKAGIAHRLVGYNQDLYKQPVVRMLIELCRTLSEPLNNNSLHHTLVGDLFLIGNDKIAPLAARARMEHERLEDLLISSEDPEILQAIALINSLREEAASLSVGRLLYKAIVETGFKNRLMERIPNDDDAGITINNLGQYFDSLKAFESIANQPTATQYLISLPALQAAGERTDDDTLAISNTEVSVLTIHKAKGLEWDTVYIPDCTEFSFPLKNSPKGLRIPEPLRAASVSPADEHYAEERRLMYVAVTRAKSNLALTFADKGSSGGARKPSRFLTEIFGDDFVATLGISDTINRQQSLLELPAVITSSVAIPAEIYDGDKLYLSVSQASTLLNCPLNFYYKYVLRAPEDPTASSTYGTILHAIIEQINKARQRGEALSLEDFKHELKRSWSKAGYASKKQQERAFNQANKTLERYFAQAISAAKPVYVEEKFSAELVPEGIVLRGRYDAVYNNGEGIEIRDYKTTTIVTSQERAKSRASASTQLAMYALAWQLTHSELPALLSLHFVDTDLIGSVKKTQRGIDGLRQKLAAAKELVREGKFNPGSKHDYCIHP